MSVLSDGEIRHAITNGLFGVEPFAPDLLQPASLDVRLGAKFRVFRLLRVTVIDPWRPDPELMELVDVPEGEPFVLHPHEFVLGVTQEYFRLGPTLVGRLDGKSSLGRIGLSIHSTAGFIDPGFEGTLTLEISNDAFVPILLRPGMRIGQISLMRLGAPAQTPYGSEELGSKYQGQTDPEGAR